MRLSRHEWVWVRGRVEMRGVTREADTFTVRVTDRNRDHGKRATWIDSKSSSNSSNSLDCGADDVVPVPYDLNVSASLVRRLPGVLTSAFAVVAGAVA